MPLHRRLLLLQGPSTTPVTFQAFTTSPRPFLYRATCQHPCPFTVRRLSHATTIFSALHRVALQIPGLTCPFFRRLLWPARMFYLLRASLYCPARPRRFCPLPPHRSRRPPGDLPRRLACIGAFRPQQPPPNRDLFPHRIKTFLLLSSPPFLALRVLCLHILTKTIIGVITPGPPSRALCRV